HQDYIARLEEEEKAPQQSAAACGCQGPATAMVPAATAGGQGRGPRPRPRCPAAHSPAVKDRSYNHGAQRPARGVGARCPRAARQPTPAPRPARVYIACLPVRTGPATTACLAHHTAFVGGQNAEAVLLVRAARPGLDAGARRHYIPNAYKKGGKAAEDQ